MTLVLPNAKAGLDELIRQLDGNILHRAHYFMDFVEVHIELPKFKFDHTAELNQVLQEVR